MAKRFGVKFNPETTLKNLETTHIEVFLEWNILRSPKTKTGDCLRRSTVQFMYKNLQILYCLETETQLPRRINVLINGYIEQDLTAKHNLIAAGLDKPTCSVANLYHLPYFHWCQDVNTALHERYRVQVALKYPKEGVNPPSLNKVKYLLSSMTRAGWSLWFFERKAVDSSCIYLLSYAICTNASIKGLRAGLSMYK